MSTVPLLEHQPLVLARDHFFGRDNEIQDILKLLGRPDLACLTVLGPGGVGKTRLLTQISAILSNDSREPFPDGIWFVPLASISDAERVPAAVAYALSVELTDDPAAGTVIEFLREREALVILDNVEQIIEAAPFVSQLAVACRDVKIIVTSRRPLRISGEQEYILAPLPLPATGSDETAAAIAQNPAVALFIQRAHRVNPLLEFDERTLSFVVDICRGLDGLPLAIELAGARTKALSPAALASQLGNRLRVLTGGPRDAPSRQQTLRSAIAWSYDLLTPAEQALFRRLSVFTGGFSLNAVEALENAIGLTTSRNGNESISPLSNANSPSVLDTISSLVDHSLIQSVETELDDPRWTMLQTIHEFGNDELAAKGEAETARRAHAAVYAQITAAAEVGFYGKDQAYWLARLTADESNVRAALEWSVANGERELALQIAGSIWRFWSLRHAGNEARRWLAEALTMPGEVSPFVLAIGHRGAGCLAEDIGDYETAARAHSQALALWEEIDDQPRRARSIDDLGNIAHDQGEFAKAVDLHHKAHDVAQATGDRRSMAAARANLGSALFLQGEIASARDEWQGVLDSGIVDDPVSRAMIMNNLAVAHMHLGELESAATILEQTLGIHEELGTLSTRADVFVNLSDVETRRGDRDKARIYFDLGLDLYRLADDPKGLHNAFYTMGTDQIEHGDPHAALRSFQESLRYADRANNRMGIADGIERIASLSFDTSYLIDAAQLAGAAQALRDRSGAKGIPAMQQFATDLQARLRDSLGDNDFERAFAIGLELTPRQATSRAHDLAERLIETPLPDRVTSAPERPTPAANPFRLTKREIEVLRLLSEGKTDREIAAAIYISTRTAGSHVTNIFGKLGVESRAAAVATAFRNNLL